ncbi:MAG: CHASE2 domain-containing protein, partial [Candidatus Eremiobacteraeota bacterium]|nr:CHASE2 domain-containing protein [Candidatus Eremiobacteraeota bacterium]
MSVARFRLLGTAVILGLLVGLALSWQLPSSELFLSDIEVMAARQVLGRQGRDKRLRLVADYPEDTTGQPVTADERQEFVLEVLARGARGVVVTSPGFLADTDLAHALDDLPLAILTRKSLEAMAVEDSDGLIRRFRWRGEEAAPLRKAFHWLEDGDPLVDSQSVFRPLLARADQDVAAQKYYTSFKPISLESLREPEFREGFLSQVEGSVIIVGNFEMEATGDEFHTSSGKLMTLTGTAALLDALLSDSLVRTCPWWVWVPGAAVFMLLAAGAATRFRPLPALLVLVFLEWLSFTGGVLVASHWQLLIPLVTGVIGMPVAMGHVYLEQLRRSREVGEEFGAREGVQLGGREREVTILFTNLPEYLKLLEKQGAAGQLTRRREYNEVVLEACARFGGRVVDYQGDAQMIGFGLEENVPHAHQATAAAMLVVERVQALAASWGVGNADLLKVHAGVCTGPVAQGHVGARQKMDIALIGDTTNTAARLMGAAMKLDEPVVISLPTRQGLGDQVEGRELEPVSLKGKAKPVPIFAPDRLLEEPPLVDSDQVVGSMVELPRDSGASGVAILLSTLLGTLLCANPVSEQLLDGVELRLYDLRHRMLAAAPDPRVVVAGIDEESMDTLGPWPWPRAYQAQIAANLFEAGATAVFYDLLFEEAGDDEYSDQELCRAVQDYPHMVLAMALTRDQYAVVPVPLMPGLDADQMRQRFQVGHINTRRDADGVIRSGILAAWDHDDNLWPSSALALLGHATNQTYQKLQSTQGRLSLGSREFDLRPDPQKPYETLIVFRPPVTGPEAQDHSDRYISVHRLLDPEDRFFKRAAGTVVLIGQNLKDDVDLFRTPLGSMKGVDIHAQAFETLWHGPRLVQAGRLRYLYLLGCCLLMGVATTLAPTRGRTLVVMFSGGLFLVLLNLGLYLTGWWFPLAATCLGAAASAVAVMLMRFVSSLEAATRFLPREVVHALLFENRLHEGLVEATVLLTDIRGYTSISETRSPVAMLDLLNDYHQRTVSCYERHGGLTL